MASKLISSRPRCPVWPGIRTLASCRAPAGQGKMVARCDWRYNEPSCIGSPWSSLGGPALQGNSVSVCCNMLHHRFILFQEVIHFKKHYGLIVTGAWARSIRQRPPTACGQLSLGPQERAQECPVHATCFNLFQPIL